MRMDNKRFSKVEKEVLEKIADYGIPYPNDVIFSGGEISPMKDWVFDQCKGYIMIPVKNFGIKGGERTYVVHLAPAKDNPVGRPYSLHKILRRAYELWGKGEKFFEEFFIWME